MEKFPGFSSEELDRLRTNARQSSCFLHIQQLIEQDEIPNLAEGIGWANRLGLIDDQQTGYLIDRLAGKVVQMGNDQPT